MSKRLDNLKGAKGARAGKDPKSRGRGRPFGAKAKATLEREKVAEEVNQRIFNIANGLVNAQASLAKGVQILYRVDKRTTATGKVIEEKPVIVTDPEEIKAYIDGELGSGEGVNDESTYYYITTKEPQSQAVDSLMNRALGKPKETMEIQGATKLKVDF